MLGYRPHEREALDTLSLREISIGLIGWRRARQAEANVYGLTFFGPAEEKAAKLSDEDAARLRERSRAHYVLRQQVGKA
ncbi:MAG TPA: hypothetical protein VD838_00535 [Anaeromyxobacteraceae bacterium]|nr:hypothetical protein [Anaeromyxobacteraceae bacterium]